ncbi:hypothetical protein NMY22_g13834 [Coprinellus aureogranulatus]|nr:hypothetical protein NMY22_g13834 [Coprinellus aureogranulatus]
MYFHQAHTLQGAHKARIRWLQLSSKAAKLASADEQGILVVWDVKSGVALVTLDFEESISVVVWDGRKSDRLFIGFDSGIIRVVDNFMMPGTTVKTGVKGAPVHAICPSSDGYLAIAIGSEVHIARESRRGVWMTIDILPEPKLPGGTVLDDSRVRPRCVHFYKGSDCLIVSYLNHGIVCFDLDTLMQLWEILPLQNRATIGYSALLSHWGTLVVTNMSTGATVHSIKTRNLLGNLDMPLDANRNVPCAAGGLEFSYRIACGSHEGLIYVWDISTNELVQTLKHNTDGVVQCVAAQSFLDTEYVASAVIDGEPSIKLWKATIPSSLFRRLRYLVHIAMNHPQLFLYSAFVISILSAFVISQVAKRVSIREIVSYIASAFGWTFQVYVLAPLWQLWDDLRRQARGSLLSWLGAQDPAPTPLPTRRYRYPIWRAAA